MSARGIYYSFLKDNCDSPWEKGTSCVRNRNIYFCRYRMIYAKYIISELSRVPFQCFGIEMGTEICVLNNSCKINDIHDMANVIHS